MNRLKYLIYYLVWPLEVDYEHFLKVKHLNSQTICFKKKKSLSFSEFQALFCMLYMKCTACSTSIVD